MPTLFDDMPDAPTLFGDMPSEDVVPEQEPRGIAERTAAGWKHGFGEEPLGLSHENRQRFPMLAPFNPLLAGADFLFRAPPGVLSAGAGAVAGALEGPGAGESDIGPQGMSRTQADKLQRDLTIGGQALMVEPGLGLAAARPMGEQQAMALRARRAPEPVAERPAAPLPPEERPNIPAQEPPPAREPPPTAPAAEREAPPVAEREAPRRPEEVPIQEPPPERPTLFEDMPAEEPPAWATERIPEPGVVEEPRVAPEAPAEAPAPAVEPQAAIPDFGKSKLGKGAPETITQFIARNGGLELDDLTRSADFDKIMVGRYGRLARKNGKSIDGYWREALIEAGYLPEDPGGGMARDVRNEIVDRVQRDRAGEKQYSAYDLPEIEREAAKAPVDERSVEMEKYADRIIRAVEDAGSSRADIDPKDLYDAADLMWRGEVKDPIQALTRVYERVEEPPGVRGTGKAAPEGSEPLFGPGREEGTAPRGWESADVGPVRRRPAPFIHPEVERAVPAIEEFFAWRTDNRPDARLEILRAEPLRDAAGGLDYSGFAKTLQPVAKAFADRVGKLVGDVPVFTVPERDFQTLTQHRGSGVFYREGTRRFIVLNADYVYSHPQYMTHVVLHEGIHAASANAIEAVPTLRDRIHGIMNAAMEGRPSLAREYGFQNAKEFVAEVVSNSELQRQLQNTPLSRQAIARLAGHGKLRTLWDAFVESLRQALGFTPRQRTALEYALNVSEQATRPEYARMGMRTREATQDFGPFRRPPPGPAPGLTAMETAAQRVGEKSERGKTFVQRVQDRFNILKTIQKEEEQAGIKLTEGQRAYEAEGIQHGRTQQQMEEFQKKEVDPFVKEVADAGLTLDEVGRYAEAVHAPERNEKMFREWGVQNAAGITDQQAAAVIAQAQASGKAPLLQQFADTLQEWRRKTLDILVDGGVMTRQQANAGVLSYPNYVPLKSDRDTARAQMARVRALGSRDVMPVGRVTQADNPIGYMVTQRMEAIHLAEENRVRNVLAKNIRANPVETETLSWYDNKAPTKRVRNPMTGLVSEELNFPAMDEPRGTKGSIRERSKPVWQWGDDVVPYKLNGEQRYMRFGGEDGLRIARAFNRMRPEDLTSAIQKYGVITRGMARLLTQYNPAFGPFNFLKDFLEAHYNIFEFKGALPKLFKNLPGAFRGAFEYELGNTNSAWAKIAEEADRNGARVRFLNLENPTVTFDRMQRQFQGLTQPLSRGGIERGIRAVAHWIEFSNNVFENATRIAAYQAFRELGWSPAKAGFEARELTLNFTRKGEWGATLGAGYFFANASIQGTARMARAMQSPRVQALVAAELVGGVALLATYNSMFGGTDPEDGRSWYSKVPNWIRKQSFVIMDPRGTGGYIAPLPVPYGYGVFKNAVDLATEAAINPKQVKATEVGAKMLSATIDAFNPLGSDENPWLTVFPSAMKPFVQLGMNENAFGFQINPEPGRGLKAMGKPGFKQYFRSANPIAVSAAKWLSDITGGTADAPGWIDVRPGTLEHGFGAITGGLGRTISDLYQMGSRAVQGQEQIREKIPLIRRFYGSVGFRENQSLYFKEREKVFTDFNRKIESPESASVDAFRDADKNRVKLNKEIDAVRADKNLTPKQRDEAVKNIQDQQEDWMLDAMRQLNQRRGFSFGGFV